VDKLRPFHRIITSGTSDGQTAATTGATTTSKTTTADSTKTNREATESATHHTLSTRTHQPIRSTPRLRNRRSKHNQQLDNLPLPNKHHTKNNEIQRHRRRRWILPSRHTKHGRKHVEQQLHGTSKRRTPNLHEKLDSWHNNIHLLHIPTLRKRKVIIIPEFPPLIILTLCITLTLLITITHHSQKHCQKLKPNLSEQHLHLFPFRNS